MEHFLEGSLVHPSWTPDEDEQLLRDFRTIDPRWKLLSKLWEVCTQRQLKNRWYSVVPHRMQGHIANHHSLAHILGQNCRGLPVTQVVQP
jgi:hypothetical protein